MSSNSWYSNLRSKIRSGPVADVLVVDSVPVTTTITINNKKSNDQIYKACVSESRKLYQ